jgi:hypothetical protein
MSKLPAKHKHYASLEPHERVEISVDIHKMYERGKPYTEMARKHNVTTDTVKKLLKEYAAYLREARPETRTFAEVGYRQYIDRMIQIQENSGNYPALVVSQAMQGELGARTRLDKILGHEQAGDVEGMAEGVASLVRRAQESGMFDYVNADDLADFGEIEEAEILDDDDSTNGT